MTLRNPGNMGTFLSNACGVGVCRVPTLFPTPGTGWELGTIRVANGPLDLANEESVRRELARLREELAGPFPSPLERLLVQRVVLCWLQSCYADASYPALGAKGCVDLRVYRAAEQRQEWAQRRLSGAVKTLATARKLLGPKSGSGGERPRTAIQEYLLTHDRFVGAGRMRPGVVAERN